MPCRACPFECGVDRSHKLGVCRAPEEFIISQAQLHFWEEPPISGTRGSGTIFFTHCNLSCRFCQNYDISQLGHGHQVSPDRLLAIMLELEQQGAHNINLVTPTHYSEQLIPVLKQARSKLKIPIVWNSNGYEKVETLLRLEGLVQVYLPDFKYFSPKLSKDFSSAPNYAEYAGPAIMEMKRQVGTNRYDEYGVIEKGLIIRHLVLPGHTDDSKAILEWIADNLGTRTHISLMAQYYPTYRAAELPGMDRRLFPAEYEEVRSYLLKLGFEQGYCQDLSSAKRDYTPEFKGRGL
ncbi:MAG: radical SAM protein [candidate division WOR-3 bacterium]